MGVVAVLRRCGLALVAPFAAVVHQLFRVVLMAHPSDCRQAGRVHLRMATIPRVCNSAR